jgi:hypothetical protein
MHYAGGYRQGLRDGLSRVSDADTGDPLWEVTWSAGELHGPAKSWHLTGLPLRQLPNAVLAG